MTMTEVHIAPSEHPVLRRWFEGDHLDLLVWESEFGDILKFRLLSRELGDDVEGYSWDTKEGLRHGHFPRPSFKEHAATLTWENESQKPAPEFISAWKTEGPSLPPLIRNFIQKQMDDAT